MSMTRARKDLYDLGVSLAKLKTMAPTAAAPALAAVSTANATDLATAQALANANKVAINNVITILKNAGLAT